MSAPRHLWSGDWRRESSEHTEELTGRRRRPDGPAEVRPATTPPQPPAWREVMRTVLAHLRSLRPGSGHRLRATGLVVSLALLSAGAAYVVTSLVVRAMGGA